MHMHMYLKSKCHAQGYGEAYLYLYPGPRTLLKMYANPDRDCTCQMHPRLHIYAIASSMRALKAHTVISAG